MKNNYSQIYKDRFILKHKNRYDYSLVEYKKSTKKVKIICNIHGIFEQEPIVHLRSGCPSCSANAHVTKEQFIKQALIKHANKYNYEKINYINMSTHINIICKKHGEFIQIPSNHISRKSGCPKCNGGSLFNKEWFISQANLIHNNMYDYKLVEYINNKTKVKIICSVHGMYEQAPVFHIHRKNGCPKCKSSQGEKMVNFLLKKENIKYYTEYSFDDCLSPLGKKLKFDFFLPRLNVVIEYDGIQHQKPIDFFGGEKAFKKLQQHDKIKDEYCKKNNIIMIRV